MHVKMIVGHRNRRIAANELIRKKPLKAILRNKPYKSNQYFEQNIDDIKNISTR